jgi:stage II sporulation protein D
MSKDMLAFADYAGNGSISVELFDAHRPIRVLYLIPPFRIVQPEGETTVTVPVKVENRQGRICLSRVVRPSQLIISAGRALSICGLGTKSIMLGIEPAKPRQYRGKVLLSCEQGGAISILNRVGMLDYVKSVVASEAFPGAPKEMLKAQAILVQTLNAHKDFSSPVSDSTEYQSYLGCANERPDLEANVKAVWDKLLCYHGRPITVYYHSTCAGGTSDGAEYALLHRGRVPYLQSVSCKYCKNSPFWKPTVTEIPMAAFSKVFGPEIPVILQRDKVGRPIAIKLSSGRIMNGLEFWWHLGQCFGWDKAPGTRYDLKKGTNGYVVITSTGAGHGIGMCQWGASGMARQGKTYQEILDYYFPGTEVRTLKTHE